MRIIIHFFTALALLTNLVSCGQKKDSYSKSKNEPLQLYDNGKLIASVFKSNNKEYHIWTKEEVKDSKDAITTRNRLNLKKELVAYFYSDSTLDEGHYYSYYLTIFVNNPLQAFDMRDSKNIYTESKDTITFISNQSSAYDLYTNRQLGKNDIDLLKRALNYRKAYDAETVFLYLNGNTGENYYASYNGVTIHSKPTTKKIITNIISELNAGMTIETKGNLITFLDKIDRAKNLLNTSDDESSKKDLRNSLISFQKIHFPNARKAYFRNAKNELWEKDIEVSMSGKNITFTGYMFVKNQIIKDTYLEIKDEISRLRFKTVGFRAFDGDDKTYWETDSKDDSII